MHHLELEGREPTINTPPHLSRHPNGIDVKEGFWLEQRRHGLRGYDTTQCWESAQLCGSTKSRPVRVRLKVVKDRVSIFIVWDGNEMMSIYSGDCRIYTPHHSVHLRYPVSPYTSRRSLMMYFEAVIERIWRCTWRLRSTEPRDTLGGRDRATLEIHLETALEWTQRCTLWPGFSEYGDALGDQHRVNSEMHLEAGIERVWR